MDLRIDELLKSSGGSQTEMAHALGVKPSTVSKWVSGKNSPPTKKLQEIAEYFGVEPLFLFRKYAGDDRRQVIFRRLLVLDDRAITAVDALTESFEASPPDADRK